MTEIFKVLLSPLLIKNISPTVKIKHTKKVSRYATINVEFSIVIKFLIIVILFIALHITSMHTQRVACY